MEFWLHGFAVPGRVAELARRAEAWGFAGLLLADSQNLTADIWVELSLAAAATSRLRIGPGVTNPVTRHLAVTASAAATLQRESGGRVSLGIGKGDSALSQIGLDALTVREFEEALGTLQGFLCGEEVLLRGGVSSRIRWLAEDAAAKVPVHVAASGPRTIAAAARHTEGVDLTVGAEVDRVARGVAIARGAAPAPIQVGAYLNVAVALLGLAFVAISFNLDAILEDKQLPGRAIETLILFAYPLAASLLVQLPGLSEVGLGIGGAVLAAGLVTLALMDLPRWRSKGNEPLSWRLTHVVPGVLIATLAVVGAVATITTSIGGLYWLAGAMVIATTSGLMNSWVLLVEIKR